MNTNKEIIKDHLRDLLKNNDIQYGTVSLVLSYHGGHITKTEILTTKSRKIITTTQGEKQ